MSAEPETTPFSYECHGCGLCCHGKRIQTNPYEVLRLARNRGLRTGDFIGRFMEAEGPFLRVREDGGCVFLEGTSCSVHDDRPLVCRTYPLGRIVDEQGRVTFVRLNGHPRSPAVSGSDGTIAGYLAAQGAGAHIGAGDRLQDLFYRFFDALHEPSRAHIDAADLIESAPSGAGEPDRPFYAEWFDVDAIVADACVRRDMPVPTGIDEKFQTYLEAMETWLATMKETYDEPYFTTTQA